MMRTLIILLSTCSIVFFFIPIAEIPDFLDADECELIIALAENKNLRDNPKGTDSQGIQYEDPLNTFRRWDLNNDQYIDPEEVSHAHVLLTLFSLAKKSFKFCSK